MLGLRGPDEYEIAVCGYTSDLGGKNLQSEWYAIKVPDPDLDLYSFPSLDPERYAIKDPKTDPDPDPYLDPSPSSPPSQSPPPPPSPDFSIEKMGINPSIGKKQVDLSPSAKEKDGLLKAEADFVSADFPPVIMPADWKELIISFASASPHPGDEPFASASPHPGDEFVPSSYRPGCTHLFSLGGLDPVGSDSDGDGAHPFESERCLKVWSLEVNKPDAGWKAVPLMTFPNRYNPQSVALCKFGKLYVLGGFSRSQFPAEAAAKGVGWMEAYDSFEGWKPLPNPPSGFSLNDDSLIFTALDDEMKILLAQYNHGDMNCDSATFYVYDVMNEDWTTLEPPVRKLLSRYPDRTGRRSVAVGNTLYWGLFEDEDINVQAYDLNKDIWFHGSFNIRPVLGKDEFLADNEFPASPPLLHLANQKFCLFFLTSIYDEKNCEGSYLYLNCLILDVSPINDNGDNHQHDYYDHVCYKVRDDVNVDDKEDNANYHVHPHDHFWRLSISIVSIQKYPLVNPIQLCDAWVGLREMDRTAVTVGPGMDLPIMDNSDRYELVRDIGSGNFGVARLMRDKQTNELVTVKYIERGEMIDENVQREIINHRSLRHPNIVRFKEVMLTPTHLAIVMEYASGGELFERLCNAGRFSEDEARFFFQQLIAGVSYCHAMQVCHRDLKLENAWLDGSPAPRLKICGFGNPKSSVLHSQPKSTVGTPAHIAPEVLLRQEYDGKIADVWSCGVTLFVMLVGKYPFEDPDKPQDFRKTIHRILKVQYSIPDYVHISPECCHLISRIFVADPAKRISIPEIRNHEWFLKNLPADLMDEKTMNNQFEEPDQPMQSIDEIMQIIAEATIPAAAVSTSI